MKGLIASLVAVAVLAPLAASGQSLAAIARKEEERRKAVAESSKVYTNKDLKADPSSAAEPAAPGNATANAPVPQPSTQVPSVNLPGGRVEDEPEVKDETYWRGRITAARAAAERSRIFADALQSRINALNTDFVNRDDPAQRAQIELERQRAIAELDRVTREIAEQAKVIASIEEEARKAGVPPGWLR